MKIGIVGVAGRMGRMGVAEVLATEGVELAGGFQVRGNFIEQGFDAVGANGVEHGTHVVGGMGDVRHGGTWIGWVWLYVPQQQKRVEDQL